MKIFSSTALPSGLVCGGRFSGVWLSSKRCCSTSASFLFFFFFFCCCSFSIRFRTSSPPSSSPSSRSALVCSVAWKWRRPNGRLGGATYWMFFFFPLFFSWGGGGVYVFRIRPLSKEVSSVGSRARREFPSRGKNVHESNTKEKTRLGKASRIRSQDEQKTKIEPTDQKKIRKKTNAEGHRDNTHSNKHQNDTRRGNKKQKTSQWITQLEHWTPRTNSVNPNQNRRDPAAW